jgi:preprotein translocase subunit SecF
MFDFIGKKNYFFVLSLLLILAGIIGYFVNGVKMDVQFEGGTVIQVGMNDDKFDTGKAEQLVKATLNKTASAQKLKTYNPDNASQINLLKLQITKSEGVLTDAELNKLIEALRADKEFSVKPDAEMSVQSIQPAIGEEIRNNGILAVILSSLVIIVYIWWRFRVMSGLSAGITSVIALMHDTAMMLAVYTIFRVPINESFIAAVLTILGFSMNDTVVIYDRIRENSHMMRKTSFADVANISINQTLSRSINTTVTVLLCMIVTYIFASYYNIQSIKDFTFPLLVGLTSGAYSSIFIASPLWVMWKNSQSRRKLKVKAAKA